MPIFNGINTDRLERYARRLLGIRQGGIMPSLSPEPAVSVELPFTEDALALSGSVPWGAGRLIAAVAAQFGAVQVLNTTPSAILTIRPMLGAAATAAFVSAVGGNTAIGLAAIGASLVGYADTRRPSTSFPLGAVGVGINAGTLAAIPPAGFNQVGEVVSLANVMIGIPPTVVLAPGTSWVAWCETANTQVYWSLAGTIREALPDELGGI